MKPITAAPATINGIYGQLGNPELYEEGHSVTAAIQGQKVEPNNFGGDSFTPMFFEYTAKIVKKEDKLEWEIVNIKPV